MVSPVPKCEGPGAPISVSRAGFLDDEVDDFGLADVEAGLGFENLAHLDAVELLVALGAGAPDGGAAGGVEQAELDADSVGHLAHDAAEGVDFADQVALGHAADGGIAAHLGDEVEVHGDEGGFEAHARRGHGGLAAGVSRAHHGNVVLFRKSHLVLFYGFVALGACSPDGFARSRRHVGPGLTMFLTRVDASDGILLFPHGPFRWEVSAGHRGKNERSTERG